MARAALSTVTLANLDAGPRGLETAGGLVMIDAGGEHSLALTAGDLAAATASGWFAVTTVDREPGRRAR
ncbi:MAG: hypothetical protein Q7J32_04635 [Sphingomonadaceae bacterium]|nr:hypothetical protein [Sphingomonadaceae bacterium]